MGSKVTLLAAAALIVLASGCWDKEPYPPEPIIAFESFVQHPDSARLTINFTDGDGDIGLDPGEIQPPYDPDSHYHNNLFVWFEVLEDGEWIRPELLIPNYYRIQRITPTGQNKVLKGAISVKMFWPQSDDHDTTRFQIQLVDRSLKESNIVVTAPIVVE